MERQLLKQLIIDANELIKRDTGIPRYALKDVQEYDKENHVIIITGPRRAGKSTLLRQFISQCDDEAYYFAFDDERLTSFSDFAMLQDVMTELYGERKRFIFDEIQNAPGWEKFVNRLHKEGYKVLLTGSNAHLLSREFSTFLTGRHLDVLLFPFSFQEFLLFRGIQIKKNMSSHQKSLLKRHFSEYFMHGGFPEYLNSNQKDILKRLYDDIILKDVVLRHNIREKESLKEIAYYLISNIARPMTYTKLRHIFSVKTTPTVIDFVSFLEDTFLFFTLKRYDSSLKVQNKSPKKVYCIDNGLVNAIAFRQGLDEGRLLENLVFLQLKQQHELYYFAERNECDFLIKDGRKVIQAIQVTASLNQQNRQREINGLMEAMNAFKLKQGIIITYDQEDTIIKDGKQIKVAPIWKWKT